MNKMWLGKHFVSLAVLGAAVVACGASDGGNGSAGTEAQPIQPSIAERFVAMNTQVDSDMHLVARKYLNNGTEVAMFHEPIEGHIMFSIGGSPVGPSVLNRAMIQGKSASELWALVAPGEAVPETLAQAIERSKNPAPLPVGIAASAPSAKAQFGAPAPAVQPKGDTLLSGGYCVSQFWADWGNLGDGAQSRDATVASWGWYNIPYNGVTYQAQYAACPLGNVSNLGGRLTLYTPDGNTSYWNLGPDYYVVTGVWTTGYNCGWDISCGECPNPPFCQIGGTRCSPSGFNIDGRFDSQCYLNWGESCGDNFDWISWASAGGSWCAN